MVNKIKQDLEYWENYLKAEQRRYIQGRLDDELPELNTLMSKGENK